MADNVAVTAGVGTTVASDDVGGAHYQRVKISDGTADSSVHLMVKAEDAAHTTGDTGIMLLAVRADTAAALATTDGDYIPLIVDASGRLHVAVGAIAAGNNNIGDVDVASSALPTGASTSAKQDTIIGHVDGIEALLGTIDADTSGLFGTVSGSELQVDVVGALPAGTNAIGKLAANSGVDIGDVDILSIAAGDNNIGNVDVVTLPATPAGTNSIGGTKDNGPHWTTVFGVSGAVVTSADASTATAVTGAPTAGQKLVITDIIFSVGAAMTVDFEEETSGTIFHTFYCAANTSYQITPRGKLKLATADKKLMVDTSAAGNISVTVYYYSEA